MKDEAVRWAFDLNKRFYETNAASFSNTRSCAWEGWERVFRVASETLDAPIRTVLDVACGNQRFLRFLREEAGSSVRYTGIDFSLLPGAPSPQDFMEWDLARHLPEGSGCQQVPALLPSRFQGGNDLVVCFGFLHHVPTAFLRSSLMEELVGSVRPGGVAALSFWRFLDDPKLAAKTERSHGRLVAACGADPSWFDDGDRLLGWKGGSTARFCHSFSDDDIDALLGVLPGRVHLIDRFRADGGSGQMNEYVVLRRSR